MINVCGSSIRQLQPTNTRDTESYDFIHLTLMLTSRTWLVPAMPDSAVNGFQSPRPPSRRGNTEVGRSPAGSARRRPEAPRALAPSWEDGERERSTSQGGHVRRPCARAARRGSREARGPLKCNSEFSFPVPLATY